MLEMCSVLSSQNNPSSQSHFPNCESRKPYLALALDLYASFMHIDFFNGTE